MCLASKTQHPCTPLTPEGEPPPAGSKGAGGNSPLGVGGEYRQIR